MALLVEVQCWRQLLCWLKSMLNYKMPEFHSLKKFATSVSYQTYRHTPEDNSALNLPGTMNE